MEVTSSMSEAERFWSKVNKTEHCWLWIAYRERYGIFKSGSKCIKAHRYSWVIANGDIPNNLRVLHRCDNPACVRPDHLFLGTQRDNILDMENKGRGRHHSGSLNGMAKLTETNVRSIKQSQKTLGELARIFAVSKQSVWKIRKGITWKTV